MTKALRALGLAVSLLTGTALAASAAVTADNHGNTDPTTSSVQPGTPMAPGYHGGPTEPGYQTSQGGNASVTPQVDRGNPAGGDGGGGSGGSGGGGAGGGR